jgi:hypothetical protein
MQASLLHFSLPSSVCLRSFTASHSISRNGRSDNKREKEACRMWGEDDFHNSRHNMGDPSPCRIAGKLENYQIIVVKEPITAPTVGKLCFKFVHGDFWTRFWRVVSGGERGKDRSVDLWRLCSVVHFAVRTALYVGWIPFVSPPWDVFSPLGARFVFRCHRVCEPSHRQIATQYFVALVIDYCAAQTTYTFKL